jgi:hypothetical protein
MKRNAAVTAIQADDTIGTKYATVILSGTVVGLLELIGLDDEQRDGVRIVSRRANGSGYLYTIDVTRDGLLSLIDECKRPREITRDQKRAIEKALDVLVSANFAAAQAAVVDNIIETMEPAVCKCPALLRENGRHLPVCEADDKIISMTAYTEDDANVDQLGANYPGEVAESHDEETRRFPAAPGRSVEQEHRLATLAGELTKHLGAMFAANKTMTTSAGRKNKAKRHADFNAAADLRAAVYKAIVAEFGKAAALEAEDLARRAHGWQLDGIQVRQLAELHKAGERVDDPTDAEIDAYLQNLNREESARILNQPADVEHDRDTTPPPLDEHHDSPDEPAKQSGIAYGAECEQAHRVWQQREARYTAAHQADPNARNIAALRAVATRAKTLYLLALNRAQAV